MGMACHQLVDNLRLLRNLLWLVPPFGPASLGERKRLQAEITGGRDGGGHWLKDLKCIWTENSFYAVINFHLWNTPFRSLRRLGWKLAMLQAFKVTLFALKNGLQIARPKGQNVTWCDVILVARSVQYLVWRFFPHISTFSWFLEAFRIARHRLTFGAARTHRMSLKVNKLLQPKLRHNSPPVPRISWPFLG